MTYLISKSIGGKTLLFPLPGQIQSDGTPIQTFVFFEPSVDCKTDWETYPVGTVFAVWQVIPRKSAGFLVAYQGKNSELRPILPDGVPYAKAEDEPSAVVRNQFANDLLQHGGKLEIKTETNTCRVLVDGFPFYEINGNEHGYEVAPSIQPGDFITGQTIEDCLEKLITAISKIL